MQQGDYEGAGNAPGVLPGQQKQTPSTSVRRINLTVFGVLCVFAFLYYVDVFLVVVPWLSYSVPGVTNIGILTITTGLSLYCYLFCVLLDPGKVPEGWQPDEEGEPMRLMEVKKKGAGPRICQKCDACKPPRAHHCRVCRRCVLRMDHHCPWTNNCIGHANYRAFLCFLIYVNAALVHTVGLIAAHTLHTLHTSRQQLVVRTGPQSKPVQLGQGESGGWGSIWVWALMQTLAFAMALPLAIGLLLLLGWHIQLTLSNKTTIEHQEGVRARLATQPGLKLEVHEHPYDLGDLCANLHEVMGDNAAAWLMPPCGPNTEGGTRWRTIWDPPEEAERGRGSRQRGGPGGSGSDLNGWGNGKGLGGQAGDWGPGTGAGYGRSLAVS